MRPPGSNFGRVLHSKPTKFIPPKREMSEATKLKVAIQQYAIKYPRTRDQKPGHYCYKLAQIMRQKNVTEMDETSLAIHIDKALFEPLNRTRPVALASDESQI